MRSRLFQLLVTAFIAALIGYQVGVSKIAIAWQEYKPLISITSKEPPTNRASVDFTLFWTVWDKIETKYYDKTAIDPQKILNGAIAGMVGSLGDPYTVYLPPVQNSGFKEGLAGEFQGIGAELGMRGQQIIVSKPLYGSPAQKAGVRIGDSIIKVDNVSTFGWDLNQAVSKIRGPKGTTVTITVVHKDDDKQTDIKITRDTITVKSVESWVKKVSEIEGIKLPAALKDKRVAYIRLSQFGDKTNKEWVGMVNAIDLEIKKSGKIEGIVLDLRNNPGGYLHDAVFISSEFIKSGTIVREEMAGGITSSLSVSRQGLFTEIPVVVLINKGSASASEIVSGALRDHKRATLVGEISFGKGTVQTAEELGGGAGLHVTIAKWLTPNGTWVHEKGLVPDVSVALDLKDPSHDKQLEKAVESLVK